MNKELQEALTEADKEVVSVDAIPEAQQLELDAQKENIQLDLEDRRAKRNSRRIWGRTLLTLVVVGFLGSYAIVVAIGLHWLDYDKSAFAVPSVVAAGVVGTYGLAKIAVKYFFSD